MQAWKWLGLAGIAGVAATGVAVARSERRRRAYTPDDVRARLHRRLATANGAAPSGAAPPGTAPPGTAPPGTAPAGAKTPEPPTSR